MLCHAVTDAGVTESTENLCNRLLDSLGPEWQSFIISWSTRPEADKTLEELILLLRGQKDLEYNGFAEEALPRQRNQLAHYLPLQAVFKMNNDNTKITKTRVVKDAGARRSHEAALNDCLHQGENLLPLVPEVLIAFRECKFEITADIEKAFLQFEINPSDRTFLRFLWPLGISEKPDAPIREFRTRVLDFGLICSPWLHIKGVKHHLKDCL
ncbi:uncharacterized protein LOC100903454 [Galendromus occidentalis]|uniref:Uncharacterized protein LOC100903454 n=1 Tax=Galendromus occidentalis TaxID=34638 RepID=A0AAJ6QS75_9ACAR|nr:uncharacterized protein LOC100903454 [Galendromus occidentalis]